MLNVFKIAIFLEGIMGLIAGADADHDGKLSGPEKLNLVTRSAALLANNFGLKLSDEMLRQIINALVAVYNLLKKGK